MQSQILEAGSKFLSERHAAAVTVDEVVSAAGVANGTFYHHFQPFIIDDSRPPPPENFVRHINELITANRRGDAVEFWMTEVVRAPAEAVAQMRSAPTWPALEAMAHTLAYDIAVLGDNMAGKPLPTNQWTAATAPTLVMDGGASPAWIRNSARTLAGVLPNALHRTIEGQTHAAAPEVLAPEIERFFLG